MRRPIQLILFLPLFFGQISFAQVPNNQAILNQQTDTTFDIPYAQPVKIVYHIPIKIDRSYQHVNYPKGQNSSGDFGVSVGVIDETYNLYEPGNPNETYVSQFSLNDRVTLINIIHNGYDQRVVRFGDDTRVVSFNIDTTTKQLRNLFIYHFFDSHGPGSIRDTFVINSIPYQITLNHHLIGSLQGNDLFRQIARVYYHLDKIIDQNMNGGYAEDIYESRGAPIDTPTCSFSIDLTTTDTTLSGINATKEIKGEYLHVYSNDPSGLLTFSFSSSDHNRELIVYDLLGRKVNRSLIPSGVTSSMMSKNLMCKGCYFAVLGNRSEKFFLQR
ncbi:MAG: hypothetical protein ABI778_07825 [Ignavibacteriota bacterium]